VEVKIGEMMIADRREMRENREKEKEKEGRRRGGSGSTGGGN
jgi:dUTPase